MNGDASDLILVGGGLQSGLVALAELERRPEARVTLIERGARLGGNHTWCFHALDVPVEARSLVEPLVVARWPRYEVRFPGLRRTLESEYACVDSERFDEVVRRRFASAPRAELVLGRAAREVGAHRVVLDDGRVVRGALVVDARGPSALPRTEAMGFQKFVGLELELHRPHETTAPLLMDATVPQDGGFRFFYALPLSPRRVLIEDTCFSRDSSLDVAAMRDRVLRRAVADGLSVAGVVREESGVLPMPLGGEPERPRRSPLVAGYAGGWFHPATGYSLPAALRLALALAARDPGRDPGEALGAVYESHREQYRYLCFLNAMLFRLFAPGDMRNVFERFYGLPAPLVERFYAMQLTARDRARILVGKPPAGISLRAAAQALRSSP